MMMGVATNVVTARPARNIEDRSRARSSACIICAPMCSCPWNRSSNGWFMRTKLRIIYVRSISNLVKLSLTIFMPRISTNERSCKASDRNHAHLIRLQSTTHGEVSRPLLLAITDLQGPAVESDVSVFSDTSVFCDANVSSESYLHNDDMCLYMTCTARIIITTMYVPKHVTRCLSLHHWQQGWQWQHLMLQRSLPGCSYVRILSSTKVGELSLILHKVHSNVHIDS